MQKTELGGHEGMQRRLVRHSAICLWGWLGHWTDIVQYVCGERVRRSDQKAPPKTRAPPMHHNQRRQGSASRMRTTRRTRGLQMPDVNSQPMKTIKGQTRMMTVSAAIFKNIDEREATPIRRAATARSSAPASG